MHRRGLRNESDRIVDTRPLPSQEGAADPLSDPGNLERATVSLSQSNSS